MTGRGIARSRPRAKAKVFAVISIGLGGAIRRLTTALAVTAATIAASHAYARTCEDIDYQEAAYTVCTVDARSDRLRLFSRDGSGRPYATFAQLAMALTQAKETLVFAMNAGMFEANLGPVGLLIEGGTQRHAPNTRDGPGNFHMKPNGVFYFGPDGAGVMETSRFLAARLHPVFATQSGPMLVVDGTIHPKLQPDGTSQKLRNGVGVRDGHVALFAISREPVSFWRFASLFRDRLGCRDALFLDGTVSSLYAPQLGRTFQLVPVGPMVGLTEPTR